MKKASSQPYKEMRKRSISLDVVRIVACMMIVETHCPPVSNSIDFAYKGVFLGFWSFMAEPGVGLFLLISGYLLLPVQIDLKVYFRKRFSRIIFPTLMWTLIYLLIKMVKEQIDASELLISVLSIPFSPQGHPILWYMYVLIGLYLVAPIISPWLLKSSKHDIELYLLIWLYSLIFPVLPDVIKVDTSITGILYYFSGYIGFFLLGFYLKRYSYQFKSSLLCALAFIACCIPLLVKKLGLWNGNNEVYGLLSIPGLIMTVFWFIIIVRYIGKWIDKAVTKKTSYYNNLVLISNLTFGVYLSHILFMRDIVLNLPFVIAIDNYPMKTLVIWILSLFFSFIGCFVISRIPIVSDILIGFKCSKK